MATKNVINEPAFETILSGFSLYDCIGLNIHVEILTNYRDEEVDVFKVVETTERALQMAERTNRKVFYTTVYEDTAGDGITFHVFTIARDRRQAKSIFKRFDRLVEE